MGTNRNKSSTAWQTWQFIASLLLSLSIQQCLAKLEVEDLVQSKVEQIHLLPVHGVLDVTRLYGVDCGLDDCPGALGGEEAVQELGKWH